MRCGHRRLCSELIESEQGKVYIQGVGNKANICNYSRWKLVELWYS